MTARCAAVIGGGIAGLSAAVGLGKAGYDVTLFERAPEIRPMGAALSIWRGAMAGLDWLECGDAVRAGSAPIRSIALSTRDGRALFGPVDLAGMDSWLPMRTHLQAVLAARLDPAALRLGHPVEDVRPAADKVEIIAQRQAVGAFDLCVVADGIHSAVADRLLGNRAQFRSYVGVLGVASQAAGDWPEGHGEEVWHGDERFGLFDAGEGRRYWFYMRTARGADEVGAIDHAFVAQRSTGWASVLGETVRSTDPSHVIPVAMSARPAPKRLGVGRIVCVGDAAHAMEPNQGQGGCQGIEDGWALGVLAQRLPPEDILPALERLRLARLRSVMRDSLLMGRLAHYGSAAERAIGRAAFAATPASLDGWQLRRRLAPPAYA